MTHQLAPHPSNLPWSRPSHVDEKIREAFNDIVEATRRSLGDENYSFDRVKRVSKQAPSAVISDSVPTLANDGEKLLWRRVFYLRRDRQWNTSLPIQPPLEPEPPQNEALRYPVGHFVSDLPPSKCSIRKAKTHNHQTPPRVHSARRKGEPAFIQARYSKQTSHIDYLWCDKTGKGVDPRYIERLPSNGESQNVNWLKAGAVEHADNLNAEHAMTWNLDYAAYLMRRRLMGIMDDLRHGSNQKGQRVPPPMMKPDFSRFQKLRPLEEVIARTPSTGDKAMIQIILLMRRKATRLMKAPGMPKESAALQSDRQVIKTGATHDQ